GDALCARRHARLHRRITAKPARSAMGARSLRREILPATAKDLVDHIGAQLHSRPTAARKQNDHTDLSARPSLAPHAEFAAWKHIDQGATTFPRRLDGGSRHLFFITAWIGLGGLDQIVLNFAREL